MTILSSRQTVFTFLPHRRHHTEAVDEVAGGANGKGVDGVSYVDGWTSEGQTAGVYGTGFSAGFLARVGDRDRTWGPGNEVGSDEVRTMAEQDFTCWNSKIRIGILVLWY